MSDLKNVILDEAVKAGVFNAFLGWFFGKIKDKVRKSSLPKVLPQAHDDPRDEDVPDPVASAETLGSVLLQPLWVVLPAKRFPAQDADGTLIYTPEDWTDAIPYGSKVTVEGLLFKPGPQKEANGIKVTPGSPYEIKVTPGSPYVQTTAFYCKGPDGKVAQIGPGDICSGTSQIGAGGTKYAESKGMVATFRLAVEGDYELWADNSAGGAEIESNHLGLWTS